MSLFDELKRRNVFKVALFYGVASWVILQVAELLFDALDLPSSWIRLILALVLLGFPIALIVSWVYELTPEGLKRESEIKGSRSIARETGRKLSLATIAFVVVGAALLLADRFLISGHEESEVPRTLPGAATVDDSIPIVAVLPFKATGSDDGGFLASGLHDDLLTRLAKLDAFRVISRTSMMEYAGTTKNMRQIGEELGAGFVLEGGIQAHGNRVRISAQLIDAPADEHIWADSYDRELTAANLFEIQAELAVAIANQLRTVLSDADRALIDAVPTRSTEAYSAYLRALEMRDRGAFTATDSEAVVTAFEAAVGLDPEFALAWSHLSVARTRLAQILDNEQLREAALTALAKARALQPDLLEAELAWAVYLYRGLYEYEEALRVLEALEQTRVLNAFALELKAYLLRRVGQFRRAHETMLEAQRLAPRSVSLAGNIIPLAFMSDDCDAAGRHAEAALSLSKDSVDVRAFVAEYELECTGDARRASELLTNVALESPYHYLTALDAAFCARDYERLLTLSESQVPAGINSAFPKLTRSQALVFLGRDEQHAAALASVAETIVDLEQQAADDDVWAVTMLALYHALQGEKDATRRWIKSKNEVSERVTKGDQYTRSTQHFYDATFFAIAGLDDDAVAELRVMLEEPGGRGFRYIDAWPDFDGLRNHPVYVELRGQFGDAR